MNVEKAGMKDIESLVLMRTEYLAEDNGGLDDRDLAAIQIDLTADEGLDLRSADLFYLKELKIILRQVKYVREKEISVLELKATEDGYPLYRSVGFRDDRSKYRMMKWSVSQPVK